MSEIGEEGPPIVGESSQCIRPVNVVLDQATGLQWNSMRLADFSSTSQKHPKFEYGPKWVLHNIIVSSLIAVLYVGRAPKTDGGVGKTVPPTANAD
eukprot:4219015-Pyramimonas_sp.AAC.1